MNPLPMIVVKIVEMIVGITVFVLICKFIAKAGSQGKKIGLLQILKVMFYLVILFVFGATLCAVIIKRNLEHKSEPLRVQSNEKAQ